MENVVHEPSVILLAFRVRNCKVKLLMAFYRESCFSFCSSPASFRIFSLALDFLCFSTRVDRTRRYSVVKFKKASTLAEHNVARERYFLMI